MIVIGYVSCSDVGREERTLTLRAKYTKLVETFITYNDSYFELSREIVNDRIESLSEATSTSTALKTCPLTQKALENVTKERKKLVSILLNEGIFATPADSLHPWAVLKYKAND
jgi:hypothetical protein